MPYISFESEECVEVDDFFMDCSKSEKEELYELCCEEFDLENQLKNTPVESKLSHNDKTFAAYLSMMAQNRWKMSKEDEELVMGIAQKYFVV